jgi:hypothetical protein
MKNKSGKWLLTLVAIACLAPAGVAATTSKPDCVRAPEGGSAVIYLLGAGLTCFGAMFLRSRFAKPSQS